MLEPTSEEFNRSFCHLSKDSLVVILEDSLRQQQSLKLEVLVLQEQLANMEEQLDILKKKTSVEKDTCLMMMYTQQRNVDKLDQLQKALLKFGSRHQENIPLFNKQNQWEWKYKQLRRHLQLYINNSNQVQEELLQGCKKVKRQNIRIYKEYEREAYLSEEFRLKCTGLEVTLASKSNEVTKLKKEIEVLKQIDEKPKEDVELFIKQQRLSTDRYTKLQEEVRSLEFRHSGLAKERDILSNQVDDLKQLNEQFKHQNHLLKETISKLEEYNKGLLEKLIEPAPAQESITERNLIETWSVEVKRLKKQTEDLSAKIGYLTQENKALTSARALLEEKVKIIQASNQELLKQNLTLSSELRLLSVKEQPRIHEKGKHDETQGQSTIITSMQMNWVEYNGKRLKNFLSHGPTK